MQRCEFIRKAGLGLADTGVLDAVGQNTVEGGHTCGYYYHEQNKTFSLDTTPPFPLA